MTEKLLIRYLKVKALAEGGEQGEKDAAKKILARLEAQNPGIEAAAARWQAEEDAGREAARRGQAYPPPQPGRDGWRGRVGNWEEIFRYAAGVYETVRDVMEEVSDTYYGQTVAEEVSFSGGNRNESVFVRLKFPYRVVQEARALNVLQKESFRQTIHNKLDEYLDAILEE